MGAKGNICYTTEYPITLNNRLDIARFDFDPFFVLF